MFRMKLRVSLCLAAVAALLIVLCGACGGSHSNGLSAAQAQAVSGQVLQAVALALESALLPAPPAARGAPPSLSTVVRDIYADQSSGCVSNPNGESCDWPVSFTDQCPGGGTIGVSGDINGTLSNTGSGSIDSQLTVTPASCSVSNLVINGDPNILIGTQINFANDAPVYPISLTEHGGISYGPNPSGSCQLNVTYTITSATSCTASGTVCGQSVSGSC